SFALVPLLFLAARNFKNLNAFGRDLSYGILLTVFFYFFFTLNQGHGWGYRYLHPVLGNLFILASWSLYIVRDKTTWRRVALIGVMVSLFMQIPFRCLEVRSFVRHFSVPYENISKL